MRKKRNKKLRKALPVPKNCFFCKNGIEPDYKQPEVLGQFINDRQRINSHGITGICAKHQRRLARAIKRSRHLSLLPFISATR